MTRRHMTTALLAGSLSFASGCKNYLDVNTNPNAPESVVKLKREELGLDKPVYTQYFDYLGNVVHGDFGTSTRTLAPAPSW